MASRYRVVRLALIASMSAGLPTMARGQSLAPAAGNWALEGGIGDGTSAGLLKFRTPSSAWLFTIDGLFSSSKTEFSNVTTG